MSKQELESIKVASDKDLKRLVHKHLIPGTRAVELPASLQLSLNFDNLRNHNCIVKDCWGSQEYGFWTCREHRNIETAIRGTAESARPHEHILLCDSEAT